MKHTLRKTLHTFTTLIIRSLLTIALICSVLVILVLYIILLPVIALVEQWRRHHRLHVGKGGN